LPKNLLGIARMHDPVVISVEDDRRNDRSGRVSGLPSIATLVCIFKVRKGPIIEVLLVRQLPWWRHPPWVSERN
jgi:hypothetical protein